MSTNENEIPQETPETITAKFAELNKELRPLLAKYGFKEMLFVCRKDWLILVQTIVTGDSMRTLRNRLEAAIPEVQEMVNAEMLPEDPAELLKMLNALNAKLMEQQKK